VTLETKLGALLQGARLQGLVLQGAPLQGALLKKGWGAIGSGPPGATDRNGLAP
jgi:uncharacterized protein YjbI with pentapeptide repeats